MTCEGAVIFSTAPTSYIGVPRGPSKISEREGDMAPRRGLHKRAAREEEEGRRMAADVRVLTKGGMEIREKETRVRGMIHGTNRGSQREDAKAR